MSNKLIRKDNLNKLAKALDSKHKTLVQNEKSRAEAKENELSNLINTKADKTELDTKIEENKYSHPSVHPASMITTTDDKQFVSQTEKNNWNLGFNHAQTTIHAPSNAQKNSDITKAEIEAKLTGTITTHSHDVNSEGSKLATESYVQAEIVKSALEGQIDTSVFALKENIPTKVSQLENDMEYLPSLLGTYTKMELYQDGDHISMFPQDCVWAFTFITTSGQPANFVNNNYIYTVSYIPVKELTTYALFYNQTNIPFVYFAFYNEEFEFVQHTSASTNIISVPEGAAYLRTSIIASSMGIAAGEATIDENGHLTYPTGIFEMYEQNHTNYEASEMSEREVICKEDFYIPFECILDGSVDLTHCNFSVKYPSINICDPSKLQSGYNAGGGFGKYSSNTSYVCTEPIVVSPGDGISMWKLNKNKILADPIDARFISVYDKNLQLVEYVNSQRTYIIPENGHYVMITLQLAGFDNDPERMYIQRHNNMRVFQGYHEPLKPVSKIDRRMVDGLGASALHVYLPPEICIPAGMTIELYNNQCCLEADKYHIQWIGDYGDSYDWKYVIKGEESLVGQNFTLIMNVYNDALDLLEFAETTVKIVSNTIDTNQLIIPIGDSLTNDKPWLSNIHSTLSNGKVSFRGTRGTTDPTLENGITHEGRSGARSDWYNNGDSVYDFDNNGLSTLPDVTTNPFWNPTKNAFDFDYYCNNATDGGAGYFKTSNGVNTSITPTGVMIFLGANGVSLNPTDQVTNITTLVNNIRSSVKGASIPIYVVNTQFRAPYILATTADGFATNSGGEFKFQNDLKYFNLMKNLNTELASYNNVHIVPIATTHDSAHNYPFTEVNVNPYNDNFTEKKYTDTIHPMICGYLQMAATMYGSICANYKNQ